jgi:hypothetical protein
MITSFSMVSFVQCMVFASLLHPLHISVTEIEYDEKDKALEIMMRVFVDDLEVTMKDRLKQPELDILSPKGITVDQMMIDYLNEHFQLSLDNKLQKIKYLGHEREDEAFIFYVEVSNVKKWKTIQVMNNIIMEVFEDQSNLVHVTVKGKVKSLRLIKDKPQDKLTFDSKE